MYYLPSMPENASLMLEDHNINVLRLLKDILVLMPQGTSIKATWYATSRPRQWYPWCLSMWERLLLSRPTSCLLRKKHKEHATKEHWYNKDEVIYYAGTSALAYPTSFGAQNVRIHGTNGCVAHSSSHRYKLPLVRRWAPWSLHQAFDMNKLYKWPLSGSGKINLITLLGLIWEKEANSVILTSFEWVILTRPPDKWYI